MKKLITTVLLVQFLFVSAYSADFLTSARGGGIGFSFFVLGDDPSGALYNPAALGYISGWQSQFMYNKRNNYGYPAPDEDPYNGMLGVVFNKPEWGSFAFNSMQSGSVNDASAIPTINHFTFSFGREFSPGLSMGTSVKYLDEYGYSNRSALDFDLGITYRTTSNIILAAAAENIAHSKLTPEYMGIAERLPRRERFGGAYILQSDNYQAAFLLASQIQQAGILEDQTTFLTNIGTEWWFNQYGAFSYGARLGYTLGKGTLGDINSDYNSFSGGISLNYKIGTNDIRIDYSIETFPYETVDGSNPVNHYMALNFGWGGVPSYHRTDTPEKFVAIPPAAKVEAPPVTYDETEEAPEVNRNPIDRDTEFDSRKYERYDVEMDVSDVSGKDFKRIVFYLRPQSLLNTNSWKLYIFKAKIKKWSEEDIDRWALKVIEGKGVPPINVIWDGISQDGKLLPSGKYYYILTAVDQEGQHFATAWENFNIE